MSAPIYYVALVHKDEGSEYGVSFPDFPGCISAGASLEEALAMGREALESHVGLMVEDGEPVPEPTTVDVVMADPANADGLPALVPLTQSVLHRAKAVRVNVTLPEDTLREIDQYAEEHGYTRSGLLLKAARKLIEAA